MRSTVVGSNRPILLLAKGESPESALRRIARVTGEQVSDPQRRQWLPRTVNEGHRLTMVSFGSEGSAVITGNLLCVHRLPLLSVRITAEPYCHPVIICERATPSA